MTPAFEFVGEVSAQVSAPVVVGRTAAGERRMVPVLGGRVDGPMMAGEILPGGADYQLIRSDGVAEIEARYAVRLDAGGLVYVVNRGIRHAAPEDMARLLRGEPVPPARVYFRTVPCFETEAPGFDWLHRAIFLGFGERDPDAVRVRIYRV